MSRFEEYDLYVRNKDFPISDRIITFSGEGGKRMALKPDATLPTSGTARFSNPLSVDDFVKKSQFSYYTPEALSKVTDKIAAFAEKEGLRGHGRSVAIRKEENP